MEIKEGLLYSTDHEWIQVEGNIAAVGITAFAQEQLGEIVFVELPTIDEEVKQEDTFGTVESVKAASDIIAPVSGKIIEVNETLEDSPEIMNDNPYGAWIAKIELSDAGQLDGLMDAAAYAEFIK